jgi:hypothetical protein
MSSLGPDGTFLDERATLELEVTTDFSAAPLWVAFRDRYTRARERPERANLPEQPWAAERPDGCLELACCA